MRESVVVVVSVMECVDVRRSNMKIIDHLKCFFARHNLAVFPFSFIDFEGTMLKLQAYYCKRCGKVLVKPKEFITEKTIDIAGEGNSSHLEVEILPPTNPEIQKKAVRALDGQD